MWRYSRFICGIPVCYRHGGGSRIRRFSWRRFPRWRFSWRWFPRRISSRRWLSRVPYVAELSRWGLSWRLPCEPFARRRQFPFLPLGEPWFARDVLAQLRLSRPGHALCARPRFLWRRQPAERRYAAQGRRPDQRVWLAAAGISRHARAQRLASPPDWPRARSACLWRARHQWRAGRERIRTAAVADIERSVGTVRTFVLRSVLAAASVGAAGRTGRRSEWPRRPCASRRRPPACRRAALRAQRGADRDVRGCVRPRARQHRLALPSHPAQHAAHVAHQLDLGALAHSRWPRGADRGRGPGWRRFGPLGPAQLSL